MLRALLLCCVVALMSCGGVKANENGDSPVRGEVLVGATDTAQYMPLLRGKRVAVLANHTAMFSSEEHIVDMMHREGISLAGIFAPEHGFRGSNEAGAIVKNSVDERTGVPIL